MPELSLKIKALIDKEIELLVDRLITNKIARYSAHEAVKAADYIAYKFDELRKERIDILGDFSTQYNDRPVVKNTELRDDPYLKALIDSIVEPVKKRTRLVSGIFRR